MHAQTQQKAQPSSWETAVQSNHYTVEMGAGGKKKVSLAQWLTPVILAI
jgi:hypothetical protein